MTQDETIALWQRCEEARGTAIANGKSHEEAHEVAKNIWNSWANTLLKRRKLLEDSNEFHIRNTNSWEWFVAPQTEASNETTLNWMQAAKADFSGFSFESRANFGGFIFPGQALFGESTSSRRQGEVRHSSIFNGDARFSEAVFHMDAVFDWAEFGQGAGFRDVQFRGIARFDETKFGDTAWFFRTVFLDDVWFGQCKFGGFTNFESATFEGIASFSGTKCEGALSLNEASFKRVPDFTQTSFLEAPRFDNVRIPNVGFFPGLGKRAALDTEARFRALRRLAIAAHDHENELKVFKAEVRVRRMAIDKPWHAAFWFGILYDALSDFGRSMMRPLYLWLLSLVAFAAIYLVNARPEESQWFQPCSTGEPSMALKALTLSAANALPLIGSSRGDVAKAFYECVGTGHIPVWSPIIQIGQTLWSAVLIFLFLLALRNQFKIK